MTGGVVTALAVLATGAWSPAIGAAKKLITGADVRNGSLTGADIRNGSLRASDFRAGELRPGPPGPPGPRGEAGTPDVSNFYDKAESDARFVRGRGERLSANVVQELSSFGWESDELFVVPGVLSAKVECLQHSATPQDGAYLTIRNESAEPMFVWLKSFSGTPSTLSIEPGSEAEWSTGSGGADHRVWRLASPSHHIAIEAFTAEEGSRCRTAATAEVLK